MGIQWQPLANVPECLQGIAIGRSETGFPVSQIRSDTAWVQFLRESVDMKKELQWDYAGGQSPAIFTLKALEKQLECYQKKAGAPTDWEAFDDASVMLQDALMTEIGSIEELTLQEAVFGTDDGRLAGLPLDTGSGFGLSKLSPKKLGLFENHLDYLMELVEEDHRRVGDDTAPLWAWASKGSLKDARIDIEKLSRDKSRLFTGANTIVSINGRRYVGDFVARFMKRCADGGFFGIVSLVLARGGWHELMRDLTDNFTRDLIYDFDVARWDKDFVRLIHYHLFQAICSLAPPDLAKRIWRHYERVVWGPCFVTMIGILFYCFRGMMSGDVATVVINTLAQALVYMYLFCKNVPKDMRTYQNFRVSMTGKFLGDDSALTLQPMFERMLDRPFTEEVINVFGEFGWTVESPRSPAGPVALTGDFTFVGHMNIWAEVPTVTGLKRYCLPVLPFNVVLSINEWRKLTRNLDVPEKVRDLARYYAAFERAFPYLWSKNPEEREFPRIAYKFLSDKRQQYRVHANEQVRKVAIGIPTLVDIVELYFPPGINRYEIVQGVQRLLVWDQGRA